MDVRLGWLTALLQLDDGIRHSCKLPNTSGRPLLAVKGAVAQTKHSDAVVRIGQSSGHFFIVIGDGSACL